MHNFPMPAKDNLKALMESLKLSANALSRSSGVPQPTISRIVKGDVEPDTKTLKKLAPHLGVPFSYLVDDSPKASPVLRQNFAPYENHRLKVPVISLVAAGAFKEIGGLPEIGQGDRWEQPEHRLGVRGWAHVVDGPSMDDGTERGIPSGWLIFCDPDLSPTANAYVIAKQLGEQKATFKQLVYDDGKWYLRPLNRQFPIVEIDSPDMRVIAVVTETRPPSRKLT